LACGGSPVPVSGAVGRNIPSGAAVAALTEKFTPVPAALAAGASSAGSGPAAILGASGGTVVPVQAPVSEADAPAKTYKIGDTGPAGGLIFYDKGNDSDGWRYLEAAPASTERKGIQWGPGGEIKETMIEMGAGKNNTQIIVNYAVSSGGTYRAAWLCDALESGGYDDWFLPSKAELNLMYLNLKERGLGDFSDGWYWSSSETGSNDVWTQNFTNGNQSNRDYNSSNKANAHTVRACRRF
jgi:hypothetical protein